MSLSTEMEGQHKNLIEKVKSSTNPQRAETIKALEEAYRLIWSSQAFNDEGRMRDAIEKYETLRRSTIKEYKSIILGNKESLKEAKIQLTEEQKLPEFTRRINNNQTKLSDFNKEEKSFIFKNFTKIGSNITNTNFVKEALDYGGPEKSEFNYRIYISLNTNLKSDFGIVESCLQDKDFKGYISNNNEDITTLIPKSFFENPQNTRKFLETIVGMEGYKVADIIPRVISVSSNSIQTKKGIYVDIMKKLNPMGITQVLHDMSDEVFDEYMKTEKSFVNQQLGKEKTEEILKNRQINEETFQLIISKIESNTVLKTEELTFLDTQMIKSGGVKKYLPQLRYLLEKKPEHFIDLKSIQGEKELAIIAAKQLKTGVYLYLSSDLKQDIDLLKTIFQTQDDFDIGNQFLNGLTDLKVKKEFLLYLKQQGINIGALDTYSLRSAEANFEEKIAQDIRNTEGQIKAIEGMGSNVINSHNGDYSIIQNSDKDYM